MKKCLVVLVLLVTTQAVAAKRNFYELLIDEPRSLRLFKNLDAQITADDVFYSDDHEAMCALLTSRQMVEGDDQYLQEFMKASKVPKASSVYQRNTYAPIGYYDPSGVVSDVFFQYTGEQVNTAEMIMIRDNKSYTAANPLLFCIRFIMHEDF